MSTALMYSFAQRADARVLDEPLYGYFLARTGADRPDREATLSIWPTTADGALRHMGPQKKKSLEAVSCFASTSPTMQRGFLGAPLKVTATCCCFATPPL